MAALTDSDRAECWAEVMRREDVGTLTISKADVRALMNAVDDWVVANATAFNAALPQPGRGALSSAQKALILSEIVLKRYVKGAYN
jgi:hypothetical protein